MAEEESLARGESRIKFSCKWMGTVWDLVSKHKADREKFEGKAKELADLLLYEEELGFAPMAPDGRIGGNGAVFVDIGDQQCVLVSKSGKEQGKIDHLKDLCLVSKFDTQTWACEYYSEGENIKPTSDTPMHYSLLTNVKGAKAALHGHAIEKEEVAKPLNIPCSLEETLFSTPADTKAMFTLLEKYPFPDSKIFVRKNHGFFILGVDLDDCRRVMNNRLNVPSIVKKVSKDKVQVKKRQRSNLKSHNEKILII